MGVVLIDAIYVGFDRFGNRDLEPAQIVLIQELEPVNPLIRKEVNLVCHLDD